jgi:hypothetical protein
VGELAATLAKYPHIGKVVPAMGYSEQQVRRGWGLGLILGGLFAILGGHLLGVWRGVVHRTAWVGLAGRLPCVLGEGDNRPWGQQALGQADRTVNCTAAVSTGAVLCS